MRSQTAIILIAILIVVVIGIFALNNDVIMRDDGTDTQTSGRVLNDDISPAAGDTNGNTRGNMNGNMNGTGSAPYGSGNGTTTTP